MPESVTYSVAEVDREVWKRQQLVSATTIGPSGTEFDCDASGGSFIVTLPPAGSSTRVLFFKKIDSSANTITIDADGSETIDGSTTAVLSTQWDAATIVSNGSQWLLL